MTRLHKSTRRTAGRLAAFACMTALLGGCVDPDSPSSVLNAVSGAADVVRVGSFAMLLSGATSSSPDLEAMASAAKTMEDAKAVSDFASDAADVIEPWESGPFGLD